MLRIFSLRGGRAVDRESSFSLRGAKRSLSAFKLGADRKSESMYAQSLHYQVSGFSQHVRHAVLRGCF